MSYTRNLVGIITISQLLVPSHCKYMCNLHWISSSYYANPTFKKQKAKKKKEGATLFSIFVIGILRKSF